MLIHEWATCQLRRSRLTAPVHCSRPARHRATDNIFIERVWRSLKYEDVYLHDYATLAEAEVGIGKWIRFYNVRRPHQAHGKVHSDADAAALASEVRARRHLAVVDPPERA